MTSPSWLDSPTEPRPQHGCGSAITLSYTTLCRTPLDEWPTRRRPLPDNTYNTHKRQTSMPPEGFAPAISASERPQTHALDRAAPEIGHKCLCMRYFCHSCVISCLVAFWYKGSVCESDSRQLICTICSMSSDARGRGQYAALTCWPTNTQWRCAISKKNGLNYTASKAWTPALMVQYLLFIWVGQE